MSSVKQRARQDDEDFLPLDAVIANARSRHDAIHGKGSWDRMCDEEWDREDGRPIQRRVMDDLKTLNADPAWRKRVDDEWAEGARIEAERKRQCQKRPKQ